MERMNTAHASHPSGFRSRIKTGLATTLTGIVLTVGLSACGGSPQTQSTTFPFSSESLQITNSNSNFAVTVSAGDKSEVEVSVKTTTAARGAETPEWTLNRNVLDVGSPCGKEYVGLCEGSFAITVPRGTEVTVNGTPVAVR